jgi:hypothetical protein
MKEGEQMKTVEKVAETTNREGRWQKYPGHSLATRGGLTWQSRMAKYCGRGGKEERRETKSEDGIQ